MVTPAAKLHGHGKTGAVYAGVVFHHHRQVKLLSAAAFIGSGAQAIMPALPRRMVSAIYSTVSVSAAKIHVAFVFTVFIIKHHHTAAFAQCICSDVPHVQKRYQREEGRLIRGEMQTSLKFMVTRIRAVARERRFSGKVNASGSETRLSRYSLPSGL